MAINTPDEYSRHLTDNHAEVAAFGGAFLLLVFLNFLFDDDKELHWLGWIEEKVGKHGTEGPGRPARPCWPCSPAWRWCRKAAS